MAFDLGIAPKWNGKFPVMDTAHFDDLNMRSSINQHIHRMQPAEADEKAYGDYKHDQLVAAAAHHLTGMAASHAAGNMEAAQKHGMMYGLALHQLGHKDLVSPPDEVRDHAKNTPSDKIGNFRAHKGDAFSLPPRTPDDAARQPKVLETDVKAPELKKDDDFQQQGYQNHPLGATGGGLRHPQGKQDELINIAYQGALPIESKFSPASHDANAVFQTHPVPPKMPVAHGQLANSPEAGLLAGALAARAGIMHLIRGRQRK